MDTWEASDHDKNPGNVHHHGVLAISLFVASFIFRFRVQWPIVHSGSCFGFAD